MYECVCCQCGFDGRVEYFQCTSCNMYGTKDDFTGLDLDVCDGCAIAHEETDKGGTYADRK